MTNALSNPYELTLDGITCKTSPFGAGFYITNEDVEKLGDVRKRAYLKSLFASYHAEQSKELDGIKVFSRKDK